MPEFYPSLKAVHMQLAMLSGALFALRGGAAVCAGARWPRHVVLRYTSYAVDTLLLLSASLLLWSLYRAGAVAAGALANGWLALKLVLLVGYIVLGALAMRPGRSRTVRGASYLAALLVFACIYGIARAHHPLGWLGYLR